MTFVAFDEPEIENPISYSPGGWNVTSGALWLHGTSSPSTCVQPFRSWRICVAVVYARIAPVSAPPLPYPYWWQAKYDERLGPADLATLGRYQAVPTVDGLHRPLPGFEVIPGSGAPGTDRD